MKYQEQIKYKKARWLYSIALYILLPLAAFVLLKKIVFRSKAYAPRWYERFGFIPKPSHPIDIWFHCVSVGEINAISPVVNRLLSQNPELQIAFSCTTPTGSERIIQLYNKSVFHFYLPFDTPIFIKTLLKKLQAKCVVITEVELWPNLTHYCEKLGMATFLVNGRMTDKSLRQYSRFTSLFKPMIQKFSLIIPQTITDKENYLLLGALPNIISEPCNIKFDQQSELTISEEFVRCKDALKSSNQFVFFAGSTHQGEETFCLDILTKLKLTPKYENSVLVVVPRHPERFDTVEREIITAGFSCTRWSHNREYVGQTDVLLIDAMGILNQAYSLSDCAFVGGSIVEKGGHNPLEATTLNVPVIMGPHIYNNKDIIENLIEIGALKIVNSPEDAITTILGWQSQKVLGKPIDVKIRQLLENNQGATQLITSRILSSI